jgi:hypothetical protein
MTDKVISLDEICVVVDHLAMNHMMNLEEKIYQ